MLEQKISTYVHHLESPAYWQDILGSHSPSDIENTIIRLLHNGNVQTFSEACLFFNDLTLAAPRLCDAALIPPQSEAIIQAIERGLNSPALVIRINATHTLGRVCATGSLPLLRATFEKSVDHDPLLLPDLAFEVAWLSKQTDIPWISHHCLRAPSYLSRWAGVQVLDKIRCYSDSDDWQPKHDALVVLSNDENHHVKNNARFILEEMVFEKRLPAIEFRPERKRLRRELESRRPTSFDIISAAFIKHLQSHNLISYTPTALDSFVTSNFDSV